MDFFDWILVASLTATFLIYIAYLLILKVFSLLSHPSVQSSEKAERIPTLSVIVPTYNEASVIRAKIESLTASSYPKEKYEIIAVDSGSTDGTLRILEEYGKDGVILLKQEKRMGKANAINFALQKVNSDIIVLTDANAEFDPDALNKLVQKFDKNTGAVLPRLMPCGKLSYWDEAFHELHHLYKSLESKADSVFIVFGELFAFRRELVDRIDENAVADDLEIALTIRGKNYKIIYSPDVKVREKVPSSQREVRAQKTRRIFGIIQAMIKNLQFFLNPRYGLYGLLIFPMHFIQMTLGPFLVFIFLTIFIEKLFVMVVGNFGPLLGASVLLISLTLLLASYLSLATVRKGASFGYNFLATQLYMIIALVNFIRGKKYSVWEKITSTRDL
jgi:cellulose synthase/poly-beta-1,6-N-acetylglucosamine synthase-like glycosyltransferase